MTPLITRHLGAIEWAARRGLRIDRWRANVDPSEIVAGDCVIGALPVNLAAEICRRSARYVSLTLDLPIEARGREPTADELERYGARLERSHVVAVPGPASESRFPNP